MTVTKKNTNFGKNGVVPPSSKTKGKKLESTHGSVWLMVVRERLLEFCSDFNYTLHQHAQVLNVIKVLDGGNYFQSCNDKQFLACLLPLCLG